jgi:hypothetical protein
MQGLNSVQEALNIFAKGITSGSRATEQHQLEAIGREHGAAAVAFFTLAMSPTRQAESSFVQQLMAKARAALQSGESWSRHFDYDGMGSFHKTTIGIDALDRQSDLYGLTILAAYVGDQPEVGLAEHLGVPRALDRAYVEVQVAPAAGDCFEFDFEVILRRLDGVLGTGWATGPLAAQAMMATNQYGESQPSFVLEEESGLRIQLLTWRVGKRFDRVHRDATGKPADTWSRDGAVLRGGLDRSYEHDGFAVPSFAVWIDSADNQIGSSLTRPVYALEKKARALELHSQIAAAFTG